MAGAFDDDWTNVLFVGRVIPNKRIEDVIRAFHAYRTRLQPAVAAAAGRLVRRLRALLGDAAAARSRDLGAHDVHFLGHVSNEELTALLRGRRPVPLRQRARRLLRAAGRGVPHAACRSLAYAATAVPATMDGGGVLYDRQGSRCTSRR